MSDPMRIRAVETGGITEVKILMKHDMETGLRKDESGAVIPAHFIQQIKIAHNGKEVVSAQFGIAVSKDPFVSFRFKGAAKGDKLQVTWIDNLSDKRSDEAVVT